MLEIFSFAYSTINVEGKELSMSFRYLPDHRSLQVVFITVFLFLIMLSIGPITRLKQDYLPTNVGLSVDQVIQKELHIQNDYTYVQRGNHLFVFYQPYGPTGGLFTTATKGLHSGYIFNIHGIQPLWGNNSTAITDTLKLDKSVSGSFPILMRITHTRDKQYILTFEILEKKDYQFSDTLNTTFDSLTKETSSYEYVVGVLNEIPSNYKIFCMVGNEKYEVYTGDMIKEKVG